MPHGPPLYPKSYPLPHVGGRRWPSGAIHKLCNAEEGEGGPAKRYHTVFLLLKLIKILTESVTWGGGGVKNGQFWRYIIYGQPLSNTLGWIEE